MSDAPDTPPVKALLLALPQSTPTSLLALYEVFDAVGTAWTQLTGERTGSRRMQPTIVARHARPFASPIGPPIAPQADLAGADQGDIVIVTDLALDAGLPEAVEWEAECDWLRRQFDGGATLCSVCTGSLLLAAAGLLDGREATTHWAAVDLFRQAFPDVALRPERTLCPSGPGHRIVTGGGQGAWEELALYLIARFIDPAEAARIAKVFVLGDRSSGQLAYSAMGRPRAHDDAAIDACQLWLADNYMRDHPVRRMAERSGLTERTFKRRFRAATGYSPVEYVQALRVEEAKQLLETTDAPVDAVAAQVGYEDPAFFRRLFKRRTGITPAAYRRKFAPAAFLATP